MPRLAGPRDRAEACGNETWATAPGGRHERVPPPPATDLAAAGLRAGQIARLDALIEAHIAEGRYPGAQIAIARHGRLAHARTFGNAASAAPPRPIRCGCSTRTPRW